MNIVVLAGGLSPERDVSLSSSGSIANALTGNGHKVLLVDVYKGIPKLDTFENLYNTYKKDDYSYKIPSAPPDLEALKRKYGNGNALIGNNVIEVCQMADVVFMGLHGGIGENGQLQATLDVFDIPYTGSGYIGCMLSMDKSISKELMIANGIPTPPSKTFYISTESNLENKINNFGLPCVVKPCSGGSSVGVTIVKNKDEITQAIKYAKEWENKIIVEKFVEGREFSAGVLGEEALPAIEIVPNKADFFDYSSKYQGTTSEICPADIPPETEIKLRELALKVHNILRLGAYSRAEFIVDKEYNVYCLESNSLPGLTSESILPKEAREAGISYNELCEKIIEMALQSKNKFCYEDV